jgi:hypothetical protein
VKPARTIVDEGEDRIRQAYGADKYDRLKALKRKYDPDNFFRINQNIPPNNTPVGRRAPAGRRYTARAQGTLPV